MKWRKKMFVFGIVMGCALPLLMILGMLGVNILFNGPPHTIVFFPFVFLLMGSEYLPHFLQIILVIGVVILNIIPNATAGWLSGYFFEKTKAICVKSYWIPVRLLFAVIIFVIIGYSINFIILILIGMKPWSWFLPWQIS